MCVLPIDNICPIDSVPLESSDKHTLPNAKAPVRRRRAAVLSRPAAVWGALVFTKTPAFDESGFKSE